MSKISSKKKGSKRVHVISRKASWAIKKEGKTRASKIYNNKKSAVSSARKLKEKGHDVIVHNKDGSIQKWEKSKKQK